jgi:hypothetical protein
MSENNIGFYQENPRFSCLIRNLTPHHTLELPEPVDLQQLIAERANLQTPPPPPSQPEDGDGEEVTLTFPQFVAQSTSGLAPTPGEHSEIVVPIAHRQCSLFSTFISELRAKFNKFMVLAEGLVGGTNSSALLCGMGSCTTTKEVGLTSFPPVCI